VRDSYVVLKDSRMFISSRTVVSSVDNSSVSSSRSAVTSCETERGKRHVYLKRIERTFQDPRVRIKALVFAYICWYRSEEGKLQRRLELHVLTRTGQLLDCKAKSSLFERTNSAISSSAIYVRCPTDARARAQVIVLTCSQPAKHLHPRPTSPEPEPTRHVSPRPRVQMCQATL